MFLVTTETSVAFEYLMETLHLKSNVVRYISMFSETLLLISFKPYFRLISSTESPILEPKPKAANSPSPSKLKSSNSSSSPSKPKSSNSSPSNNKSFLEEIQVYFFPIIKVIVKLIILWIIIEIKETYCLQG